MSNDTYLTYRSGIFRKIFLAHCIVGACLRKAKTCRKVLHKYIFFI